MRQHVNPLAAALQRATPAPCWSEVYRDPSLPLHIDIGCAHGRFAAQLAERNESINVLGLEIRAACLEPDASAPLPWNNLHLIACNAATSLGAGLLDDYPGPVAVALVLHPDPWWKKKHHKRRLLTPSFVRTLSQMVVPSGARLLLQTDVEPLLEVMRDALLQEGGWWVSAGTATAGEYYSAPTARETYVTEQGKGVFGELFIRTKFP